MTTSWKELFRKMAEEKGAEATPEGYRISFTDSHNEESSRLFYLSTREECQANGDIQLNFKFIKTDNSSLYYDDGKEMVRPYLVNYKPSSEDFPVSYQLSIIDYCKKHYGTKNLRICFSGEQLPRAKFEAAINYLIGDYEKYGNTEDLITLFSTQNLTEGKINFFIDRLVERFTFFESMNIRSKQSALIKITDLIIPYIVLDQYERIFSLHRRYDERWTPHMISFHNSVDIVLLNKKERASFYLVYYQSSESQQESMRRDVINESQVRHLNSSQRMHRKTRREKYVRKHCIDRRCSEQLLNELCERNLIQDWGPM